MKFKESLSSKIASIIFSYVMLLVLVVSVVGIVVMGMYKFYFSDVNALKEEILSDMAQNEAYHIENKIDWKQDLKSYYKNKNVYYKVVFTDGRETITNYNGESYIASASSEYFDYSDGYTSIDKYGNEVWHQKETKLGDVEVYIDKGLHKNDIFSAVAKIVEIGYSLRYAMVFIALGSLAVFIYLLCFLYCSAGHKSGGVVKCNYLDKVPFDLLSAIVATIAVFSIMIVGSMNDDLSVILAMAFIGSIDYFVALGYTMSFATRVKTRTLIKNNVLYYIFSFIGKKIKKFFNWIKFVYSNSSVLKKSWIIILAIICFQFIYTVIIIDNLYSYSRVEFFIFIMVITTALLVLAILYLAVVMFKIKQGGEKIAKGDLEYKIDTKYMYGDFKEFAESLNNINEGLQTAVNEKMRSERFKTELITNVSHDIKTPLTSIINYVDLIKKEEIENDTAKQYIDVLDRQSNRLKKLVEDLVEASKASSGSLSVELKACDVSVLVSQTIGEFEDKLLGRGLTPIINAPTKPVKIMADGRHLWRIFDNLMSNICKYAMSGTRVYIDVKTENQKAVITFRNISQNQLNVSAEELMERFVRGDKSRNTEGSGLGLSIAKSLAELQGGSMELLVDGDLFKASAIFDVIK